MRPNKRCSRSNGQTSEVSGSNRLPLRLPELWLSLISLGLSAAA